MATFNLGQLLIKAYLELGEMQVSVATGGGASSITDTTLINAFGDGSFTPGGAVFVVRDAALMGTAPENEFLRITAFAIDTGVFTLAGSFSASIGAGDEYGYVSGYYPIRTAIQLANAALRELGDVPLRDTTTLDSVAGQTEYSASASWKRRPPYKIDLQMITDDSLDNQWRTIYDWYYEPGAAGAAGRIVFKSYLPDARDIQVWYQDSHPELTSYASYINEVHDPEIVVLATCEKMLAWKNGQLRGSDAYLLQKLGEVRTRKQNLQAQRPKWQPPRTPKLMIVEGVEYPPTHFTYPSPP